jgi:hypothetical protein
LKAQAIVVTLDFGDGCNAIDISLKDGALNRVYGDGVNRDPCGRDAASKAWRDRPLPSLLLC